MAKELLKDYEYLITIKCSILPDWGYKVYSFIYNKQKNGLFTKKYNRC